MQKRCSKQQVAKFGEEKTIQRGKLRKVWPEQQVVKKLSETTMCKCVVWNDKLQKVIRNNNLKNDILGQFGNFAKKNAEAIFCKKCDLEQNFVKKMLFLTAICKNVIRYGYLKKKTPNQVDYTNFALFS